MTSGEQPRAGTLVDVPLRVLGGVLMLAGGVVAAALAVLLVPLRIRDLDGALDLLSGPAETGIGAVRVPVAVVLAVGGNLALLWLARRVTGTRWGVLLPALGWFVMVIAALRVTTEGDRLLMPDDWVATLTLFSGTLVVVIVTVLTLTTPRREVRLAGRGGRT